MSTPEADDGYRRQLVSAREKRKGAVFQSRPFNFNAKRRSVRAIAPKPWGTSCQIRG